MKRLSSLLIFCTTVSLLHAADPADIGYEYGPLLTPQEMMLLEQSFAVKTEGSITPDNLLALMQASPGHKREQWSDIPDLLGDITARHRYNPSNPSRENMTLPIIEEGRGTYHFFSEMKQEGQCINPPEDKILYCVKISGSCNRAFTAMHSLGAGGEIWTDKAYLRNYLTKLSQHPTIQTFQTASRAATYLAALKAINELNLTNITVPRTYLHSTDGHSVDDKHAVIVESYVQGKKLEERLQEGWDMPSSHMTNLFRLIEHVGLWNPNNNIIVDEQENLVYIDLEQANNSLSALVDWHPDETPVANPETFFRQNPIEYYRYITCGIKDGLFKIFESDVERTRAIIELVDQSDIIQSHYFEQNAPRYHRELIAFVAQKREQ